MKWVVKENEESLCVGMLETDIPHKIPSNIRVLRKDNNYYILAENVAGIVTWGEGKTLSILPKFNNIDPIMLLLYINDMSVTADKYVTEQYSEGENTVGLNTLARMFAQALLGMQNQPRKFNRKLEKTASVSVKGRVNWIATERARVQGKADYITTKYMVPTFIIPENIVIAHAARRVMQLFEKYSSEWDVLFKWSSLPVPEKLSYSFILRLSRTLRQNQFSGAHAYYYQPVVLAQAILGFSGLLSGNNLLDNAILFNMPSLYEEYVRTAFQRTAKSLGLVCQKGYSQHGYLFLNGVCELIPDITVYYGDQIRLLLDVKYKTPDSKDFYQMYAYMKYANITDAYVISPATSNNNVIFSFDGCRIHMISVNSSNPNQIENHAQRVLKSVI